MLGLSDDHDHDLKNVFEGGSISQHTSWSISRFLRRFTRERNEAGNGESHASHSSTQECNDHFNDLEERAGLRPQRIESASWLRSPSISGDSLWWLSIGLLRRSVQG